MAEAVRFDQTVIRATDEAQFVDSVNVVDAVNVSEIHEKEETERVLSFLAKCKDIKALNKLQASLSDELKAKFLENFNDKAHELMVKDA
jgi:mannose/fructose/N-acetylgalactosamine-specific phosphotransferase system component IIB